ncbi:MAG TPA: hypothetical protein VG101_19795 [Puia sp.]|jgi:hypothetical protein|nr:hypothetical protein [Puia sp.]
MKIRLQIVLFATFTLGVMFSSCKKTLPPPEPPLTDYFISLQVGKYVTYRMDSLNFYFYGQNDTITSYLAKDSVEKKTVDNTGATVWLVTRYLSDTTGSFWTPSMTYVVSPSLSAIDVTEDNLRFIKLAYPMDLGFSWTGNTFLPYAPYQDFFDYSSYTNLTLALWNYVYMQVNQPFTVANGTSYDSATTILQVADSSNVPITQVTAFAYNTYWSETYAKHVGLIYRHTAMWEYQPPTPDGSQSGFKIGFALTMSVVDHN